MEKDLTLYLLRHGETTMTVEGRFCGSSDPDLTEAGRAMANEFAARYRETDWTAIYSSPMRRTIQTITPLLQALGRDPDIEEGFREIDYGTWEGRVVDTMEREEPESFRYWAEDPGARGAPGGENAYQVAARAVGAVERIRAEHRTGGSVLIASHKATIRVMVCAFLGIDARRYRDRLACPLASLTRIRFTPLGPYLEALGDVGHLSAELRDRARAS